MDVAGSGSWKEWMEEMEKTLTEADASVEMSQWESHYIYRVPACIKDLNPKAYQPQVVSLGPFHHEDKELRRMEEHKRRALRHRLQRAKKPLQEFVTAVKEVAKQLESAYLDLDDKWRGEEGREKFLQMMILDGCFLLEVMSLVAEQGGSGKKIIEDYAPNDPIFSSHGVLYVLPYIQRDMLMLENQLPLLLLKKLVAVETTNAPIQDFTINRIVLRFLSPMSTPPTDGVGLGLHPLDVYRRSMLSRPSSQAWRSPHSDKPETDIMRSALELYEAGIRFKTSTAGSLHDIRFRHGVLNMPPLSVDDSTECKLLNLMAFERLHVGAGNDVTAYVFFMDSIIDSPKDVALLSSKGIIQNAVGSDKAVAKLFNSISKDVVLESQSALDAVHQQVNAYCRKPWNMWRANLIHTYFRSPWAFLSLTAAVFLLGMTVLQTVYTVLQFYQNSGDSSSAAPAPM
ncbi:hypothetical protein PR202_gb13259 [Eleusine coracana subsp. coracana]|uniref:Uncharacterized protein n=1 Tax=Eleusine coracana subsp. coracana TaxID=191504 RepID=A0AAV5ESS4_ELECO|nr:hypothetical protein QOZ80_9BG0712530 [Eleusine coracana subsp. coracana]GJN25432.1 hypothetical protein PR202_gb13259 [Eleusine coracana subsp. coracana]